MQMFGWLVSRLIGWVVGIFQLLTCLATLPGGYMNLKAGNARLEQNSSCANLRRHTSFLLLKG